MAISHNFDSLSTFLFMATISQALSTFVWFLPFHSKQESEADTDFLKDEIRKLRLAYL